MTSTSECVKRAASSAVAGEGKSSKRRYFQKKEPEGGRTELARGMRGILITCDTHLEKKAIRECFDLLNDLCEEAPSSTSSEAALSKSAGAALAAEIAAIQQGNQGADGAEKLRRFSIAQTGVGGNVMVRFEDDDLDPVHLVHRVFEQALAHRSTCAPHVIRMLPVQATCAARTESVVAALTPMLQSLQGSDSSFSVQWRRRCNTSIDKMEVIDAIAAVMKDLAPKAQVDLMRPQVGILVDVVKSVCCVSVLPGWQRARAYNLRASCEMPKPEQSTDKL